MQSLAEPVGGSQFTIDKYYEICKKYGFVKATSYWVGDRKFVYVPNPSGKKLHKSKTDIRPFFDHYYSFKDGEGQLYWVVCPYRCGKTKEEIVDAFADNYIICDILDGGKYILYKYSNCFSKQPKKIKTFDSEKEAEAFRAGIYFLLDEYFERRN